MTPTPENEALASALTTAEFAAAVGCPSPTVHGWVARGLLVPIGKRGKANLFSVDDVEKMVVYREKRPGKRSRATTPLASETVSAVVELAVVEPEPEPVVRPEAVDGHRYWNKGESDGSPRTYVNFGPVKLPVINDNTPEAQAMVPRLDPHFELDAGEAVVVAVGLRYNEPVWSWGPTGGGKTATFRQIAAILNWPVYRVNMTASTGIENFVGTTKVVIDEETGQAITEDVPADLVKAMLNGGILLIDEITACPPGILMVLQGILERQVEDPDEVWAKGESHLQWTNPETGEVIHVHPRFRIVATDNTNGQGDETGAYSGTNVMNTAFLKRFTQWIYRTYPEKAEWVKIVRQKAGVTTEIANRIVSAAIEVNKGSALLGAERVTNQSIIAPRDTLAVARNYKRYGDIKIAFKITMLNSMQQGDPDRQFIQDILNNEPIE